MKPFNLFVFVTSCLCLLLSSCEPKARPLESFSEQWRSSPKTELKDLMDWKSYLQKKGLPQSNRFKSNNLYYQPSEEGFYYQYFYFERLPKDALEVVSYIKGSKVGRFLEQDELFLGLKMKAADTDLGQLNLVGKPIIEVQNILGSPQMEKEQWWIYWDGSYVLKVHFNQEAMVEGFHYLQISGEIESLAELWTHLNSN